MVKLLMSILFETRELVNLRVLHFLHMKIKEVPLSLLVSQNSPSMTLSLSLLHTGSLGVVI